MKPIETEATLRRLTPAYRWVFLLTTVALGAAALTAAASAAEPTVLEKNHTYVREVPHASTCRLRTASRPFRILMLDES